MKVKMSTKRLILILLIGLIFLIIDQSIKFFIIDKDISLISDILSLKYSPNDGLALGIFSGDLMATMVITAAFLGFVVKLILYFFNKRKYMYTIALTLIFSGGFSNLMDRILRGVVVEYINIKSFCFNIGEILLVLGLVLVLVALVRDIVTPERIRKKKMEKKISKIKDKRKKKEEKQEGKLKERIEELIENNELELNETKEEVEDSEEQEEIETEKKTKNKPKKQKKRKNNK